MYIRGFPAPRGCYKLSVCTSSWRDERRDDDNKGNRAAAGGGGGGGWAQGERSRRRLEEVEDLWVLSYVLAPPEVSSCLLLFLARNFGVWAWWFLFISDRYQLLAGSLSPWLFFALGMFFF